MPGFLDLPAEVRLMIYRLLFHGYQIELDDNQHLRAQISSNICRINRLVSNETRPILYAQLEITVLPSKSALKFFRAIGQLNRDALREIILDCKVDKLWRYQCLGYAFGEIRYPYPSRPIRLLNILTKCSKANLLIKTEPEALAFPDGSGLNPAFASIHGYARAVVSIDDSQKSTSIFCFHGRQQVSVAVASMQQRFDEGMKGMTSPCSSNCRIHEGRNVNLATRTIHIFVDSRECPACSYRGFLLTYKGTARSIFKALKN